jgi:2-polyprenyl-6-methoxyphenol hydroxylase-like FAD-dependent oxidoreductase
LEALTRCPAARDIYFDDVVQVEMSVWHRGRVVLVGDACQCLSPIAGQGAAMAMTGAYVLAQELDRARSAPLDALASYERRLRPLIVAQQRSARRLARWVVPRRQWQVTARDLLARVALWPLASSLLRPGASPRTLRLA